MTLADFDAFARSVMQPQLPGLPEEEADQPLRIIRPSRLQGIEVPKRRWIVEDWLPKRQVTLNYADGGIGKTLLAMQLMAACALGKLWCGLAVEPCVSIGLFSEDDADELHIRLNAIREHYQAEFSDLDDMTMIDGTGQDNMLVEWDGARMVPTLRFAQFREHALDTRAKLATIDTAATTFGGNEIDRKQVTQFVGSILTKLAQDMDGAVLLNAHPSLSGIASGDLKSGSTAWNNSCRSRWAMTRPVGEDGRPQLDSYERILTRQKSNGAPAGEVLKLEWNRGCFTPPPAQLRYTKTQRKNSAEDSFLFALRASKRPVTDNIKASNYAPRMLRNSPGAADYLIPELAEAMRNLLSRGILVIEEYKKDGKIHWKIAEKREETLI